MAETPNLGTEMMEDRDRVHFAALRRARRDRVLAAMRDLDLDACVFGREGTAGYAAGVGRLWAASTHPFVPTCLVMAATDEVSLLSFSASYEGIPEEILP